MENHKNNEVINDEEWDKLLPNSNDIHRFKDNKEKSSPIPTWVKDIRTIRQWVHFFGVLTVILLTISLITGIVIYLKFY